MERTVGERDRDFFIDDISARQNILILGIVNAGDRVREYVTGGFSDGVRCLAAMPLFKAFVDHQITSLIVLEEDRRG